MFATLFVVIVTAVAIIYGENLFLTDNTTLQQRSGRFFPLFSIVRFANSECAGTNSFNGTCFTRRECSNYGGYVAGTCANNLGVCCTFRRECGTIANTNNTYFVNPNYYSSYEGGERCMTTIYPCNTSTCQLRLDFVEFSLSQPNASGVCDNDFLLISGGARIYPRICGENSGQHVYIEFNGANPITISIDTNVDYLYMRKWNLKIQHIPCDSPWRAPNGCFQYYRATSGTVMSFNYGTTTNSRLPSNFPFPGTRQMLNLNYAVCINAALQYCAIEWSQADTNSFAISGDSEGIDATEGIDLSLSGIECNHTYVLIPTPFANGMRYNTDRFCGNSFQTKISTRTPFILTVVTSPDPNENAPASAIAIVRDIGNRGFILKYRQLACAI